MTEKQGASVLATEAPQMTADRQANQINYTPNDLQNAMEILHNTLPSEIYDRINRAMQVGIHDQLSGNATKTDMDLESLLKPLEVISARRILETEYPDLVSLIENYLTTGVWFVYGLPKIGKSWLVNQIALAVSTQGLIFDKKVRKGKVLILALEDGERRLKNRMIKQNWPPTIEIDYMTSKTFREQIGYLNMAGGKRLLAYIEMHNYVLTIVDTFSRAFNLNQLRSELMTDAITPYQEFCQARDKTFLFVDHEPKRTELETSAITGLFGGIAKAGMADGLWRLSKERGKGVKIDIEGRDLVDSYSLKLRFDKSNCHWYSEGDAEGIEITERRKQILDALANLGRSSSAQIEDATGQPKGHLHTRLQDLVTQGLVNREKSGNNVFYDLAK